MIMIRSLRMQLLLGLILGAFVVLLLCGLTLHHILRRNIDAEFNHNLLTRARTIGKYVEVEQGKLEFEWAHYDPQITMKITREDGDGYLFHIWTTEGKLFARSDVFQEFHLPSPSPGSDAPVFGTLTLPDGTLARVVSFWYEAIAEDDEPPPQSLPMLGITVARRMNYIDSLMNHGALVLVIVTGATLILCAVGTAVLVHWNLRPLEPVIHQLEDLGVGDLSRRIDPGRLPCELVPLIDTINHLIAGLEVKVARERRFVADAAHELRNPISAVRANLEVGLLDRASDESCTEILRFCLDATTQLQAICERLLNLAGLQNEHMNIEWQEVDINEMVESSLADHEASAEARKIHFAWEPLGNMRIRTDPVLLSVILSNLLRNTVSYADPRDPVCISVGNRNGSARITIQNAIEPGHELDPLKAVEPFWRADQSRTVGQGHVGLGLAIAKTATERLHGRLTCRLAGDGRVFVVEVVLPIAWTTNTPAKHHG